MISAGGNRGGAAGASVVVTRWTLWASLGGGVSGPLAWSCARAAAPNDKVMAMPAAALAIKFITAQSLCAFMLGKMLRHSSLPPAGRASSPATVYLTLRGVA